MLYDRILNGVLQCMGVRESSNKGDTRMSDEYKKAITIKVICGSRIKTIPVGTTFEVLVNTNASNGYSACRGLGITSIWNEEFVLVRDNTPVGGIREERT
jgi:hypothetical protein